MKKIRKYFIVALGTMLMAMGISLFYLPNKIVGGGVSGVSTVLYHAFSIPADISLLIINMVLFVICAFVLGREMFFGSLFGIVTVSLFIRLFGFFPQATDNVILSMVYGGFLYGAGAALALSQGASTGGTDIVGRLLQYIFPQAPIGKLLLLVDGIIILVSFIVFKETELLLCGIIALVISTFTVDYIIDMLNISALISVVTDKGEEIAKQLIKDSKRGVTMLDGKGAYSNEKKQLLIYAVKKSETERVTKTIKQLDKDAFVILSESKKIFGRGFNTYK